MIENKLAGRRMVTDPGNCNSPGGFVLDCGGPLCPQLLGQKIRPFPPVPGRSATDQPSSRQDTTAKLSADFPNLQNCAESVSLVWAVWKGGQILGHIRPCWRWCARGATLRCALLLARVGSALERVGASCKRLSLAVYLHTEVQIVRCRDFEGQCVRAAQAQPRPTQQRTTESMCRCCRVWRPFNYHRSTMDGNQTQCDQLKQLDLTAAISSVS
mmetsp:Transcript_10726/g.32841  ORF Transcript_10726/g.32841 Transcript_10726/m.32841 type:complete len:214 (-) Transcript_10726:200-841(-)